MARKPAVQSDPSELTTGGPAQNTRGSRAPTQKPTPAPEAPKTEGTTSSPRKGVTAKKDDALEFSPTSPGRPKKNPKTENPKKERVLNPPSKSPGRPKKNPKKFDASNPLYKSQGRQKKNEKQASISEASVSDGSVDSNEPPVPRQGPRRAFPLAPTEKMQSLSSPTRRLSLKSQQPPRAPSYGARPPTKSATKKPAKPSRTQIAATSAFKDLKDAVQADDGETQCMRYVENEGYQAVMLGDLDHRLNPYGGYDENSQQRAYWRGRARAESEQKATRNAPRSSQGLASPGKRAPAGPSKGIAPAEPLKPPTAAGDPIVSCTNPTHIGRVGSLTKNPFYATLPANETWHRRMPSMFPFGETNFMSRVVSNQINADLNKDPADAEKDTAAQTGKGKTPAVPTLSAKTPTNITHRASKAAAETRARPPPQWDLPKISARRLEEGREAFLAAGRDSGAAGASSTKRPREDDEEGQRGDFVSSQAPRKKFRRYGLGGARVMDEDMFMSGGLML